jgi:hypothetical protein
MTNEQDFQPDWDLVMKVLFNSQSKFAGSPRPFVFGNPELFEFKITESRIQIKAQFWINSMTKDGNYWRYFRFKRDITHESACNIVWEGISDFLKWKEQCEKEFI